MRLAASLVRLFWRFASQARLPWRGAVQGAMAEPAVGTEASTTEEKASRASSAAVAVVAGGITEVMAGDPSAARI
jgi:hypothetical protein